MSNLKMDFNRKTGRFIISSPPWMVDRMRALPNRRWDPKGRVWTAPAIRANSVHIRDNMADAVMTIHARQALEESLTKSVKPREEQFPPHYVPKTTLYDRQRAGLSKAFPNKIFALLMEMRTGKTKVLIDYASAHRMSGGVDMVVVVCPYSVRKNWQAELGVHCPLDYSVHLLDTGKPKEFSKWIETASDFKWLVVGVESLAAGSAKTFVERALLTTTKALMVVDESHKIKNYKAARTEECIRLGRMAERRIIMTGTPVANHPMDFYAQFEFLDPDIIGVGDYYSFRNRYAVMGGYDNKQIIGYDNMPELMELISPFVYQASRADMFDLPPIITSRRAVSMSKQQKKLYSDMLSRKSVNVGSESLTAQTVLEKMQRLHEISGGIVSTRVIDPDEDPDDPSVKRKYSKHLIDPVPNKVVELLELLEEIDDEDSVIVWCVYREEIAAVSRSLRLRYGSHQVVEIHGAISEAERHYNVAEMFQKKKARFLVGNQTTGGVGLNMSAASVVVYYSNTFNYIDRRQSMDRTQSVQQTKSVLCIDLISEGGVDELVMEALANKNDVSEYVKKSINEISAKLSIG